VKEAINYLPVALSIFPGIPIFVASVVTNTFILIISSQRASLLSHGSSASNAPAA
jgi:hypothetical protein